ncbi:hypothetical protein MTR67_035711 [Solanum verrucosum]|uniref:Uncharacterized protein n=1 Tax=Solanum verrucosum TaxID=315347 RepID=A0AAF0UB53_SOLVR|nr:hypothetical protein MTR67_035711 [Solanum verrucosum]
MTVPVAQVSSIALEPSKGNTQVGELRDKVTGEKIQELTKSQMQLRKQGYHVTTPRFGLGFSLSEPLRISSKNGKEIASSHQTSI